jgi:hypothetical protein
MIIRERERRLRMANTSQRENPPLDSLKWNV